jgi:hypothetical protein
MVVAVVSASTVAAEAEVVVAVPVEAAVVVSWGSRRLSTDHQPLSRTPL